MARRRTKRRKGAKADPVLAGPKGTPGEVSLHNPVAHHFPSFIFGNATMCDEVVRQGDAEGKAVAICGAGPTLRAAAAERFHGYDEVWGVNSAAPWMVANDRRVTHAFTVDQTAVMLKEWVTAPDLVYLLASSVHPHLTQYLQSKGRRCRFFHNYVSIDKPPVEWEDEAGNKRVSTYEDWLYMGLYDSTVRAGSGLNGVTRAVDVARFRGFSDIMLYGADCAMEATGKMPDDIEQGSPEAIRWLDANTEFHVDGSSAVVNGQSPMFFQGLIDGRLWTTKADLVITAVQIAKWMQTGVVDSYGDTLPHALVDKDDEFFARLPALKSADGTPVRLNG